MEKLDISYPFVIFTSVLLALDREGLLLLAWTAIVAHELGHLLCLWLMGCEVEKIRVGLGGLSIEYCAGSAVSYGKDALVAFAGPLANSLLVVPLTIVAKFWPSERIFFLIGANIIIAVFNLLPAMPADGGRILLALVSSRFGSERGEAAAQLCTAITGAVAAALGLIIWLETGGNFMLFATSLVILASVFGKRLYSRA